jgi:oligoribonuclease NrnB/cAMP/cGMP phosphodiesterase (DHH superfamily)
MKPLIIYHADCDDGFGAAFCAWLKFGDEAQYIPMRYGVTFYPVSVASRDVYILDFSFPKNIIDALFKEANKVIWIDHHKSAFEDYLGESYDINEPFYSESLNGIINLNNHRSGAYLTWHHFFPEQQIPMLIQHIDDNDRWKFEIPYTKEAIQSLRSYPRDFNIWKDLANRLEEASNHGDFIKEGRAILRSQSLQIADVIARGAIPCTIPGQPKGVAVNTSVSLTSDVGQELANLTGTYGLVWRMDAPGDMVSCSLRSNGSFDVSVIAKKYDGGGHKNAAGFQVKMLELLSWML